MSVRFAPSPTGAFHLGNFRTAWISHEWARALAMPWVVRVEDIDVPRVVPGAGEAQLAEMSLLGLKPDRVYLQSERRERHWELLLRGISEGQVYPCTCSRKEVSVALESLSSAPHAVTPGEIYSGACRTRPSLDRDVKGTALGWRFRHDDPTGRKDFLVARTSGGLDSRGLPSHGSFIPSYQWACAIDDLDGAYALLVRAWDLSESLWQQRSVQKWLNPEGALPAVFHTALVVDAEGKRLEKRTKGVTLREWQERGRSPEELVSLFRASAAISPDQYLAGRVWGEAKSVISLLDLGANL